MGADRSGVVTLRRARPGDARAAADVYLASRHAFLPRSPLVHADDDVREWFATVVLPGMDVWLAEAAGDAAVVGTMVLHDGWIEHLYLAPGWTGRGVGSLLVAHAKRLWPQGLQLWTFQANEPARRFYERHGFVAVERTDGHANEERAPDVRYRWVPAV